MTTQEIDELREKLEEVFLHYDTYIDDQERKERQDKIDEVIEGYESEVK